MKKSQSGNAVLFILLAVALFGALAYTFMRGSKSGQGNLSSNQARIAAQELLAFFNAVEKAANKLRSRGCSESDISFANPLDTGTFITNNKPATAPVDGSCDVFASAGAGLNFNMDWTLYQVPFDTVTQNPDNHGNIQFRTAGVVQDLGTATAEITIALNLLKPEICEAYNTIVGNTVDLAVLETALGSDPIVGNENTGVTGKQTFCVKINNTAYNNGPHSRLMYVWLPK